ncbi:MAG: hypothetical protein RBR82_06275 [Pseudomonas sp.]|nr:hypothetical protein [Pseudomonas sp.]
MVQLAKSQKTNEDIADKIISAIVDDFNMRVGVGSIWRQLDSGRKQEIKSKWKWIITEELQASR